MATQDDYIRTALRVPPDLHKQLHEAAAANNRTFNAEIVSRLQASFTRQDGFLNKKITSLSTNDEVQVRTMTEVIEDAASQISRIQGTLAFLAEIARIEKPEDTPSN